MSWSLVPVVDRDMDELMTWFADSESADIWGGPIVRFPFTRETFREDCFWDEFPGYRLQDETGTFAAFGQVGERYGRSHFARLIVSPAMRGRGIGKHLMLQLIDEAKRLHTYEECGLFVYRHNTPALKCYQSVGFEIIDYPDDAPMPEKCHYLITRS